eukprot:4177886-Lingulodinium_polyedra.AAC.1
MTPCQKTTAPETIPQSSFLRKKPETCGSSVVAPWLGRGAAADPRRSAAAGVFPPFARGAHFTI